MGSLSVRSHRILYIHTITIFRFHTVKASADTHLKSPDPVRAKVASLFSLALQTAPLCPLNVPIQSPVSPLRSIGSLSWQALIKKTPSGVTGLYSTPAKGRL